MAVNLALTFELFCHHNIVSAVSGTDFLAESPLNFSLIRVASLVIWTYLCLYSIQRLQFGHLLGDRYKPVTNVFSLFFGPFILLTLSIADVTKRLQAGEIELKDVPKALFGVALADRPKAANIRTIELLDSSGKSFSEIYGSSQGKGDTSEVIHLAENIILNAIDGRASDLLIDPN